VGLPAAGNTFSRARTGIPASAQTRPKPETVRFEEAVSVHGRGIEAAARDIKRLNDHLVAGAAYPALEASGALLASRISDASP
jgi:hypothetical protein